MKLFNNNKFYNKELSNIGLIWQTIKPVLIFLGVNIGLTIILMMYAVFVDKLDVNSPDFAYEISAKYGVILNILIQIVTIIIIYFIFKKDKKTYPKKEKCKVQTIIYGGLFVLAVGIIAGYLIDLLIYLFPSLSSGYDAVEDMLSSSGFILLFVTTCLLAPVMEEMMCRGLVLNNLLSKKSIWSSIIISALIFGIIHLNLVQGIVGFITGIFLAIVYIKTRNIWTCILGHFLNNLVSVIVVNTNISSLTANIVNIIIIILCIYPIIKFIKEDNVKIKKCDNV